MRLALLLSLLITTACNAQLQVDITSGYRIEGLSNSRVLADGKVISSTAPKAVLPQATLTLSGVKTAIVRAYDAETNSKVSIDKTDAFSWSWSAPKKVNVEITYIDANGDLKSDDRTVELPDEPTPGPKPDPQPTDKISGLCVLVVYESAKMPSYTRDQLSVINSSELRTWFSANLESTNGLSNYRFLDKDTKFPANCDLVYCKWLAKKPESDPWIIIGNAQQIVFQGPLPNSTDQIKQLVAKWKK